MAKKTKKTEPKTRTVMRPVWLQDTPLLSHEVRKGQHIRKGEPIPEPVFELMMRKHEHYYKEGVHWATREVEIEVEAEEEILEVTDGD